MFEIERLIRQRDYLLDISRVLTSELDLGEVLKLILRQATDMLEGGAGLIALVEDGSFRVRASVGMSAPFIEHIRPLMADTPYHAEEIDFSEHQQRMLMIARAAGFQHVVFLPMGIGPEIVGIVYIFRVASTSFTVNDQRLLQSFANQAAIAVQNARYYQQILNEKLRLDAILRHSADGIMILSNALTVESINLALARMTGIPVDEAIGKNASEVIRWATVDMGMTLDEAAAGGWPLNEHSVLYVEGDIEHISGSRLSVGITYAALFDHRKQFNAIIANVRDITRFREADEAKGTFISVISHELKTPVSLIKGYASTLNREDAHWDQSVINNGLSVIEDEADKLTEMIDNLLDVSRMEMGTLTLSFSSVDLKNLSEELARNFQTQSTLHQIEVMFPQGFPTVQGDRRRLGQVISNLLNNAIKYSPDGGKITIEGNQKDHQLEIIIKDEGIGLPADQEDLIFERFYRVENNLSRKTQGVGLGLYIVRSLVEAHGGQIWAENREDRQGTAFHILLPYDEQQNQVTHPVFMG